MCVCVHSRKKAGNIFLVAFYECEDDFDLVAPETDRLYCSQSNWIGERPRCQRVNGADEEYNDGDGEDELDEDEDGDEEGEEEEDGDDEDAKDDNQQNNGKWLKYSIW